MSNRIVWFKKNLRFKDNEILIDENKRSILIYIIEPDLWKQKDMSLRQWQFTLESVNELKRQLLKNNLYLNIFFISPITSSDVSVPENLSANTAILIF